MCAVVWRCVGCLVYFLRLDLLPIDYNTRSYPILCPPEAYHLSDSAESEPLLLAHNIASRLANHRPSAWSCDPLVSKSQACFCLVIWPLWLANHRIFTCVWCYLVWWFFNLLIFCWCWCMNHKVWYNFYLVFHSYYNSTCSVSLFETHSLPFLDCFYEHGQINNLYGSVVIVLT